MYNIGLLKLYIKIKNGTIPLYYHNFWLQKTYLLNHKDIISDINEELLVPFLQENIKNATLNTNLDRWYYQQKTAFYNELTITAYIKNYFRQHFFNHYRINCNIENCYSCNYH